MLILIYLDCHHTWETMSQTDQGPVILNALKNTVGEKRILGFRPSLRTPAQVSAPSVSMGNYPQYTHFHLPC